MLESHENISMLLSEVHERCDAQLNILLCGRALLSVAHGQSKRSANVPLTLTVNQIPLRSGFDIKCLQ